MVVRFFRTNSCFIKQAKKLLLCKIGGGISRRPGLDGPGLYLKSFTILYKTLKSSF